MTIQVNPNLIADNRCFQNLSIIYYMWEKPNFGNCFPLVVYTIHIYINASNSRDKTPYKYHWIKSRYKYNYSIPHVEICYLIANKAAKSRQVKSGGSAKMTLRLMIILLLFKKFSNIYEVLVCVHGNIRNKTDLFHKYNIFVTYFSTFLAEF